MRFRKPLSETLGSSIKVDLLRVLLRSESRSLSGRELAKLVRASPSQVNLHLGQLAVQGLLHSETVGRVHVWRPVVDHVLFRPLKTLFELEDSLFNSLKAEIGESLRGKRIERAVIFGSVARGTEEDSSDIDLFVETPGIAEKEDVAEMLSRASLRFALRYGNPLSSLVLTTAESRRRRKPELWKAIESEGVAILG
jgi:predicted nucleotidyltransferase